VAAEKAGLTGAPCADGTRAGVVTISAMPKRAQTQPVPQLPLAPRSGERVASAKHEPGEGHRSNARPLTRLAFARHPLPAARGEETRGALAGFSLFALAALVAGAAYAQAPAPTAALSDPAKAMVGAWEISNAARDKRCAVSFKADPAPGGFKLEFEPPCTVFPSLRDIGAWIMTPKEAVQLLDSKGTVILDFNEVENGMYEAERKGEGLYFMRTQAAIKAETVSPEQMFGEWTLLQEAERPLCQLTLSNASNGEES
jgi:protease inhibitor Inh